MLMQTQKEIKKAAKWSTVFAVIFTLSFTAVCLNEAKAAVPKLITYQGLLKNSAGSFLTGTYSMTFKIYNVSTGGTALWTETQSSVSASSGKFSVQLGSVTALNLPFNADYWLSIKVGTDAEMSPRVRITSAGYAYMADNVVNGFTQSQHDALSHKNIEGVKDNTVNIAKTNFKLDAYSLAAANSMGDMIVDTFNDATGINGSASSNYSWRSTPNYDLTTSSGGIDSNTVLALHMNGTDGSATFTDSSSSAKSVTAVGNAQLDTAQSKFGGASGLFDTAGDYLSLADHADFDFGTGAFTVDFWVRFNTLVGDFRFIGRDTDDKFKFGGHNTVGNLYIYINGTFHNLSGVWIPSTGVWYHLAVSRDSSGDVRAFVDGVQKGSTFNDTGSCDSTQAMRIAVNNNGVSGIDAWFDEFRISKGVARWTSNFTPPSMEYSAPGSGTATVISNAYSEPAAPVEAIVIVDETLNTGSITYYVSRDNGTTWTQCTKETLTSISSQPSGTQLKWKAVITGDAELNGIAVAV